MKAAANAARKRSAYQICGIDEAGRGPLLGPLVVAGVMIPRSLEGSLRALGVKDSKVLSKEKRLSLYHHITNSPDIVWASTHISSQEIDMRRRRDESLNDIEMSAMLILAKRLYKMCVFDALQIDSVEANSDRFGASFGACFAEAEVTAQCGADALFVAVSAASIVAKVERDREVDLIEKKEGVPVGSGYPHDAVTKGFLKAYFKKNNKLPDYIRHTWKLQKTW